MEKYVPISGADNTRDTAAAICGVFETAAIRLDTA
jgi:hypothetical protein